MSNGNSDMYEVGKLVVNTPRVAIYHENHTISIPVDSNNVLVIIMWTPPIHK
jgi:hypothetical protein